MVLSIRWYRLRVIHCLFSGTGANVGGTQARTLLSQTAALSGSHHSGFALGRSTRREEGICRLTVSASAEAAARGARPLSLGQEENRPSSCPSPDLCAPSR